MERRLLCITSEMYITILRPLEPGEDLGESVICPYEYSTQTDHLTSISFSPRQWSLQSLQQALHSSVSVVIYHAGVHWRQAQVPQ